ncbi:MAG: 50S ribosomal protein L10 [Candidatus Magasanikbacteria bacterium CG10_big_fil_rev_8_21_14_0_10_47_10]|uniref:Large ribosomal subunit protein uL10 n=1 Tax=Candidatus Magasanikbacteria bacterium CG10_big_fil_rev_8_21_14_0_10_47_10 TaxID=1974652 RepID=A0A2H0TRE5_9BACT|nr:MAG: 50S ribosomal protein L10 [Candidatus Magasanikbacteria bacterium CG10_big_fil_rev_8_21_14_0_10_47_10]
MAKTKEQKQQTAERLASAITTSKSVVFANYQGLSVSEMDELRAKCREQGVMCLASKKTLMSRALKNAGIEADTKAYQGGIVAFFGQDEVSAPKVVADFAKDHEIATIFGGLLEGNYIDSAKVTALSQLPSKEQLLAQLVGTINAPVSGFVNVLAGNIRGLVTVLNGIKDANV